MTPPKIASNFVQSTNDPIPVFETPIVSALKAELKSSAQIMGMTAFEHYILRAPVSFALHRLCADASLLFSKDLFFKAMTENSLRAFPRSSVELLGRMFSPLLAKVIPSSEPLLIRLGAGASGTQVLLLTAAFGAGLAVGAGIEHLPTLWGAQPLSFYWVPEGENGNWFSATMEYLTGVDTVDAEGNVVE